MKEIRKENRKDFRVENMKETNTMTETMNEIMTGHELCEKYNTLIAMVTRNVVTNYAAKNSLVWVNKVVIDEVTSNVYLKILEKGEQFDPTKSKFKTWLNRVAFSCLIDYLRGIKNYLPLTKVGADGEEYDWLHITSGFTAEDDAIGEDARAAFEDFCNDETELNGTLMALATAGYTNAELAEQFGLTPSAVAMRVFKMRREFRACVA